MATQMGQQHRLPWNDRFKEPAADGLRQSLPKDMAPLFDAIREHLLSVKGVKEQTTWYGVSWRWSLEYRHPESDEPLAVLVPCPEDLRIAMPVDPTFITRLSKRPLKRAIRDGLELASEPFDTRWGVWSIPFANLIDDLRNLINLKIRHLQGE